MRIAIISDFPESPALAPFSTPLARPFTTEIHHILPPASTTFRLTLSPIHPNHADFTQFLIPNIDTKSLHPTNSLYPTEELLHYRTLLITKLASISPDFIFAFGPYTMWALSLEGFSVRSSQGFHIATSTSNWRGSQLHTSNNIPILPLHSLNSIPLDPIRKSRTLHDITTRFTNFLNNAWNDTERDFLINPSFTAVTAYLSNLLTTLSHRTLPLSVDIETSCNRQLTCIGLAQSSTQAICIPFLKPDGTSYFNFEEEQSIRYLLRKLLTHPNVRIIGQNFLYDAQHLALYLQIKVHIYDDTLIMQHLLLPGTPLDLNTLSSLYCSYHRYWKEDATNFNSLQIYNCRDCIVTFEAHTALTTLINYHNLSDQHQYQMKQVNEILTIMLRGVRIDVSEKEEAMIDLNRKIDACVETLLSLLPPSIYTSPPKVSPFYSSHTQLSFIFTQLFGMKPYWNRKNKRYTTDDKALAHFADIEPLLLPLTTALRQYRKLYAYRTFTHMSLSPDSRMRTSYTPTAETFRWKSSADAFGSGGNLQNLPKGGDLSL